MSKTTIKSLSVVNTKIDGEGVRKDWLECSCPIDDFTYRKPLKTRFSMGLCLKLIMICMCIIIFLTLLIMFA